MSKKAKRRTDPRAQLIKADLYRVTKKGDMGGIIPRPATEDGWIDLSYTDEQGTIHSMYGPPTRTKDREEMVNGKKVKVHGRAGVLEEFDIQ